MTDAARIWRVRHYSVDIEAIMTSRVINSGGMPSPSIFVEYPIIMPRSGANLRKAYQSYGLRSMQLRGM